MKKTKLALGIIVALGAVWTAGSWYTGKQIESRMDGVIKQANQKLQTMLPEANITLSYQDLKRGVFSSSVQLQLHIPEENGDKSNQNTIAFQQEISHGPFPRLSTFSFSPALAAVKTTLVNNETLKPLFDITEGQSMIEADTVINYGGSVDTTAKIIPVEHKGSNDDYFASQGATFTFSGTSTQDNKVSGNIGKLALSGKFDGNQMLKVEFEGIDLTTNSKQSPSGLTVGEQSVTLRNLMIAADNEPQVALQGLGIKTSLKENDKKIDGIVDYSVDALSVQKTDYGSGNLVVKLGNIDAPALKAYFDELQTVLDSPAQYTTDNGNAENFVVNSLQQTLARHPALLSNNPYVSIAPFSWKNSKGEATLTFNAVIQPPVQTENTLMPAFLQAVKSAEMNINVPKDVLAEFSSKVMMQQGLSQEEAKQMAAQQLDMVILASQAHNILTIKDNVISGAMKYTDGKVTINGETSSLEEFIQKNM